MKGSYVSVLIAFFVILFLLLVVVFRILKVHLLLPSFREMKKRRILEGDVLHSWDYFPPLWKRLLVLGLLVFFWGLMIYIIIDRDIPRIWYYLSFVGSMIMVAGIAELHPGRYVVTNKGIWYGRMMIFSRNGEKKFSGKRLFFWEDISAVNWKKEKMVIHLKISGPEESVPVFIQDLFKRLSCREIFIPRRDSKTRDFLETLSELRKKQQSDFP